MGVNIFGFIIFKIIDVCGFLDTFIPLITKLKFSYSVQAQVDLEGMSFKNH